MTSARELDEQDPIFGFAVLWANGDLREAARTIGVEPGSIDRWARDAARRAYGREPGRRMTPRARCMAAFHLLRPASDGGDLRAELALLGAIGQPIGYCLLPEETLARIAAVGQEVHR